MLIHFVSDIHLQEAKPVISERFLRFLSNEAPNADALYVLGDLFEAWVGDDILESAAGGFGQEIAACFRRLAESGTRVFLMHGNRDFLLGAGFCNASSATLLPDPTVIALNGVQTILSHGDALCTDDASYQQFRETVRSPAWQAAFLARPLRERIAEARRLRDMSEAQKSAKSLDIMDVSQPAVTGLAQRLQAALVIHGHTHRPAHHQAGEMVERWVLPDWRPDAGGYVAFDGTGLAAIPVT